jgi:aspartate carbamoyltransferase regulatory subunit
MVVLSLSDVRDEDIQLLPKIPGLRHIWMTNTKLTDQCVDDLARIDRLEIIKLDGTEISTEGIERLRLLKPKLKIEGVTRAE